MKNILSFIFTFTCVFIISTQLVVSQNTHQSILTVKGRVIADDSGKPLEYVTLTINNTNFSTVTNQDGYFLLRIPASAQNFQLKVQHLGYESILIPVITLLNKEDNVLRMITSSIRLGEIQVVSGDGTQLIKDALLSINRNYENNPNMMVAFYRESIKKGSNYLSLVEAVLDIYKESYRSYNNDQARIYIGRKATDVNSKDTIFLKFQGGISDALMLDVAKNPDIIFNEYTFDKYVFDIDGIITIDDRPQYIISFHPLPDVAEIMFRGKIYLDVEKLAFRRMEFSMNVENRKDAAAIFIRKKPSSMRITAEKATYISDFLEKDDKWYFNYCSMQVSFKVRWKRRWFGLFSSTYTIFSEMAMTDRYEDGVQKFPRRERIRSTDVIAEKVEYFQDPNFWGDYTVIEPDKEISSAIKRLSNRLHRRE